LLASLESFPSVASFVADEGNRAGWDEKKERELEPDDSLTSSSRRYSDAV
jgi:hypothetical protein